MGFEVKNPQVKGLGSTDSLAHPSTDAEQGIWKEVEHPHIYISMKYDDGL